MQDAKDPLERQNKEVRWRKDVVVIFPDSACALRLVTMLLVEQNDEWAVNKRYFSRESMELLKTSAWQAVPELELMALSRITQVPSRHRGQAPA